MPKIVRDERVFEVVMHAIMTRGYDRSTTRQMAKAAGVSEVTLFRKYGSKAELVTQALRTIAERVDFESVVQHSGDVFQDLLGIVRRYQELTATYGQFLSTLIPEMQRHPALRTAMERPLSVTRTIGALLVRYQEAGILRQEHPMHSVAALLGPLVYFAMARGTAFEAQIPPIDPAAHVRRFLEGRQLDLQNTESPPDR